MTASRAERRRQERAATKRRQTVLIAGDGVVARALGQTFEGVPHAELPIKRPGEHRWIAVAAYVIKLEDVEHASDPDHLKFMDQENLFTLSIGCYDCEMPLGDIAVGSRCTGDPTE